MFALRLTFLQKITQCFMGYDMKREFQPYVELRWPLKFYISLKTCQMGDVSSRKKKKSFWLCFVFHIAKKEHKFVALMRWYILAWLAQRHMMMNDDIFGHKGPRFHSLQQIANRSVEKVATTILKWWNWKCEWKTKKKQISELQNINWSLWGRIKYIFGTAQTGKLLWEKPAPNVNVSALIQKWKKKYIGEETIWSFLFCLVWSFKKSFATLVLPAPLWHHLYVSYSSSSFMPV